MNTNFNDLPWHDADLQSIYIDRRKPGERDIVRFLIEWPDDSGSSIIEFFDCYGFSAAMNFGIIACESILTAEYLTESKELNSIREKWSKSGFNFKELKCFKIITNSTNSTINIYALGFKIISVTPLDPELWEIPS